MKTARTWKVGFLGLVATMAVVAAACAPTAPGGGIASVNWKFKGTEVRIDDSQDEVRLFGACVAIPNCDDEPFLLNVNFRVKIGVPGSAQTFVSNNDGGPSFGEGPAFNAVSEGTGGVANFNGVQALDLLDLANTNNHLEIMGTYVWATEEDTIGNGVAADSLADVLQDALNDTIASSNLTSLDANFILDLILGNIGNALGIVVNNIPTFGLGDDVLGGGMYIGIGATGTLGAALDAAIGTTPFPSFNIPIVSLPPDIIGGGFYTLTGPKNFEQTFSGSDGQHTWKMTAGPA